MKALLSVAPGGPDTLRLAEIADPTAAPGQVVVDVAVCALNFPDVLVIEDRYQRKPPRPFAPGMEVSGRIASVGAGVADLRPGQRVVAWLECGGLAQKVAADAKSCMALPDDIPFDLGAVLPVAYGTSLFALKTRGGLRPGERVLVLGAAGGVGLAACELARAMGAHVVAAASTQARVDIALAAGAHAGIVYGHDAFDRDASKAFVADVLRLTGGVGADVIYDPVGGPYAQAALRSIAGEGRYLVVGFTAGIPSLPMNLVLLRQAHVVGVLWGAFLRSRRAEGQALLDELFALCRAGRIRPLISASFGLDDAREALGLLAARKAMGKVIVKIGED